MKVGDPIAGIADGLRCVGLIRASTLATRNRLAVLTLDSVLEISMRVYLQHKKRVTLDPVKHRRRQVLVDIAKNHLKIDVSVWDYLDYCYENIRCPLYHQTSDMTVTDAMLDDMVDMVSFLLKEMFNADAKAMIGEGQSCAVPVASPPVRPATSDPNGLSKVDAIVLSIGLEPRKDAAGIISHLRALGLKSKLAPNAVAAYLSRGGYFFKDPIDGTWKLTEFVGKKRFAEISENPT